MFSAVLLILVCLTSFIATEIQNFSNNKFTDDENRQYIKEEGLSVGDNPNSIDILPGVYPTYTTIPRTGFSCKEKIIWHYYADPETDCQIFHICETHYSKISFICPVGSIFNQKHLICDWFYNFECNSALDFYPSINKFNEHDFLDGVKEAEDGNGFDLSPDFSEQNARPINDSRIGNYFARGESKPSSRY